MIDTSNYVKNILDTLERLNLSEKTILVFLSDHGTSLGEKIGERFYGVYLYEYTMNVFTILHVPGFKGKAIDKQCSTIDIFPTILDLSHHVQVFPTFSGFPNNFNFFPTFSDVPNIFRFSQHV